MTRFITFIFIILLLCVVLCRPVTPQKEDAHLHPPITARTARSRYHLRHHTTTAHACVIVLCVMCCVVDRSTSPSVTARAASPASSQHASPHPPITQHASPSSRPTTSHAARTPSPSFSPQQDALNRIHAQQQQQQQQQQLQQRPTTSSSMRPITSSGRVYNTSVFAPSSTQQYFPAPTYNVEHGMNEYHASEVSWPSNHPNYQLSSGARQQDASLGIAPHQQQQALMFQSQHSPAREEGLERHQLHAPLTARSR